MHYYICRYLSIYLLNLSRYFCFSYIFCVFVMCTANSGLHVFDFLANSILKEVHFAIQKGKPGALSPGKPTMFLKNYKSSLRFLAYLEGKYQTYFRSLTGALL